jgi:microcystin-dependent protein
MSFPVWNSDPSFNKITSTYFKDLIDLSGNFIIRNGTIKSPANTIEFDDTYSFINFLNSVNIYGQQKLTYNAIEYDVGLQCEKVDTLVSDVATLSPIVSDTAFKCTNFYYDQALNSTIFSNNVSFGNGTIASIAINNTSFVDLTSAQSISGIKTFTATPVFPVGSIPVNRVSGTAVNLSTTQTITGTKTFSAVQNFTSNLRLDGSLLVGTAGGTVITNSLLQQIADIPTLKTITTAINYTPLTTTTLITGILQFSGTLNGWDTTNFYNAINYSKSATSDLQTQINSLNTNSVSLSASNVFTGATNQFTNTLRLDGSLVVNANGTTLTNSTLNKIQYLSNVSSDVNTSITNLNTSVSTLNTKTTKMSYMSVGGINTTSFTDGLISQTFSFTGTINNISPTTFGYISGLTSSAQTQISNLATKLTDVSYLGTTTTIANTLATSTLTFSSTLNNISTTVFGYLSGLTENIKTSLDNLSARISTVEIVGTIIMSPLYDLQTTTNNKYLMCTGQAVSRTTYSALFAKFETQFGVGDGSTTFGLPNYSAIFLRGMGNQTINGVNYGNYNSTYSPDQDSIQNHTHSGQSGSFLGTVNIQVSPSYRTGTGDSPNAYTFSNTGGMATGRINDNETKPVSMGIYYYVRT